MKINYIVSKFLKAILVTFLFLPLSCFVNPVCFDNGDCPSDKICQLHTGKETGVCQNPCQTDDDCSKDQVCEPFSGICLDVFIEEPAQEDTDTQDTQDTQDTDSDLFLLICPDEMASISNSFCIDRFEASRPDATAEGAGSDESEATSRALVIPWVVADNATAENACKAAGKRLCAPSEWTTACRGANSTTYSYGDVYDPVACNGIDVLCNCDSGVCADRDPCPFPGCYRSCGGNFGLTVTGAFEGCTSGNGVYDLNGNLWEHVQGGNDTTVRGGAYNCLDSAALHRCDYVPGTWAPSARGFRCCSDGVLEEIQNP